MAGYCAVGEPGACELDDSSPGGARFGRCHSYRSGGGGELWSSAGNVLGVGSGASLGGRRAAVWLPRVRRAKRLADPSAPRGRGVCSPPRGDGGVRARRLGHAQPAATRAYAGGAGDGGVCLCCGRTGDYGDDCADINSYEPVRAVRKSPAVAQQGTATRPMLLVIQQQGSASCATEDHVKVSHQDSW